MSDKIYFDISGHRMHDFWPGRFGIEFDSTLSLSSSDRLFVRFKPLDTSSKSVITMTVPRTVIWILIKQYIRILIKEIKYKRRTKWLTKLIG